MNLNDIIDVIDYNKNQDLYCSDFSIKERDNLFNLLYNNGIYMSPTVYDLLLKHISKLYVDKEDHLQVVFYSNKPSKKVISLLKENIKLIKNNIDDINNNFIKLEV